MENLVYIIGTICLIFCLLYLTRGYLQICHKNTFRKADTILSKILIAIWFLIWFSFLLFVILGMAQCEVVK